MTPEDKAKYKKEEEEEKKMTAWEEANPEEASEDWSNYAEKKYVESNYTLYRKKHNLFPFNKS